MRPTHGEIGTGGFDIVSGGGVIDADVGTEVGAGVAAGAGAGAYAGTGAGAVEGVATIGTGVGIGTQTSSGGTAGGFPTAVAGSIKGASRWYHVTSHENRFSFLSPHQVVWSSRDREYNRSLESNRGWHGVPSSVVGALGDRPAEQMIIRQRRVAPIKYLIRGEPSVVCRRSRPIEAL